MAKYTNEFKAQVVEMAIQTSDKEAAAHFVVDKRSVKSWMNAFEKTVPAQTVEVVKLPAHQYSNHNANYHTDVRVEIPEPPAEIIIDEEEIPGGFRSFEQMTVIIKSLEEGSKLGRLKQLLVLMAEQKLECERGVLRSVVMDQLEMTKTCFTSMMYTHAKREHRAYKEAIA